jgi:hypothetical protein
MHTSGYDGSQSGPSATWKTCQGPESAASIRPVVTRRAGKPTADMSAERPTTLSDTPAAGTRRRPIRRFLLDRPTGAVLSASVTRSRNATPPSGRGAGAALLALVVAAVSTLGGRGDIGASEVGCGTHTDCDDGNPCSIDVCEAGGCTSYPEVHDVPCDDGNACTVNDHCVTGTTDCVGGLPLDCDDRITCTTDACDPAIGCTHLPILGCCGADADCDDADPCTGAERCAFGAGECRSGVPPVCDDADACTIDTCVPLAGCRAAPIDVRTLRASVAGDLTAPSCAGQSVPARVDVLIAHAASLFTAADVTPRAGKARRLVKRAARGLGKAVRKARKAGGGRVSMECSAALAEAIGAVRQRANCVAGRR